MDDALSLHAGRAIAAGLRGLQLVLRDASRIRFHDQSNGCAAAAWKAPRPDEQPLLDSLSRRQDRTAPTSRRERNRRCPGKRIRDFAPRPARRTARRARPAAFGLKKLGFKLMHSPPSSGAA